MYNFTGTLRLTEADASIVGMGKKMDVAAAARERELDGAQWWNYSVATARALVSGNPPPTLEVRGLVLEPDENAYLMTRAHYARFYASGDGSWTAARPFVVGRTALVAGAFAGAAVANSRAKSAAIAAATPMWREGATTDVLLTDRRVLTFSPARGQWLSFWFRGVREFYPELHNWSVSFAFDDAAPLRLSGPTGPAIALWTARGILGEKWRSDSRLTPLLTQDPPNTPPGRPVAAAESGSFAQ